MIRDGRDEAMTAASCRGVSKRFGSALAVRSATLELREGELLALLGRSGCGKTTLLRLIAGLERADEGRIEIAGRLVEGSGTHVPPEKRGVGVVFQDYALFPHLTVEKNVAFGLPRRERRGGAVREMLELVGLAGKGERRPPEPSGGERPRGGPARGRAGVRALPAAGGAVRPRREAERTAAEATRELEATLEGQSVEELGEEIARLERAVASEHGARGSDPPLPDSIGAARAALEAARRVEHDADGGGADPAGEVEAARAALDRDRARAIELTALRSDADDRLATIRAELTEARDRVSDDELAAETAAAEAALTTARAEAEAAALALAAADPDAVTELADNAAAVAADARERLEATERDLRDTLVRITALGGDGLWEQREALATELVHARTELHGLERRAAAARTLLETLERHRTEARDRYAAPLRDRLVAYGRMLYGPGFDVELDDDLRVGRRYLDGLWLDVDQLSVGAREQLALLGRLACASLLGARGGVLLFDDALGNTDPDRLERLGAVLRSAGQHAQVVVLTSYPDRYRHVGGATRIAL